MAAFWRVVKIPPQFQVVAKRETINRWDLAKAHYGWCMRPYLRGWSGKTQPVSETINQFLRSYLAPCVPLAFKADRRAPVFSFVGLSGSGINKTAQLGGDVCWSRGRPHQVVSAADTSRRVCVAGWCLALHVTKNDAWNVAFRAGCPLCCRVSASLLCLFRAVRVSVAVVASVSACGLELVSAGMRVAFLQGCRRGESYG